MTREEKQQAWCKLDQKLARLDASPIRREAPEEWLAARKALLIKMNELIPVRRQYNND